MDYPTFVKEIEDLALQDAKKRKDIVSALDLDGLNRGLVYEMLKKSYEVLEHKGYVSALNHISKIMATDCNENYSEILAHDL